MIHMVPASRSPQGETGCIITCQIPPSCVPARLCMSMPRAFSCVSNFRCSSSNASKHLLVTCVCLHRRLHTSAKPVGVGCAEILFVSMGLGGESGRPRLGGVVWGEKKSESEGQISETGEEGSGSGWEGLEVGY